MKTTLAVLALLVVPVTVAAQAEDRQRTPTAEAAPDPCAASTDRARGPRTTWPGFDPRLPMPSGATSFTGIAPPTRDPSREGLQAPGPTDVTYQDCRRRLGY
jgi:hypothetical protein